MNNKIDLQVKKGGEWYYLCSTNQSKTCKEALKKFMKKYNKKYFSGTCGKFFIDNNVRAFFDHSK